MRRADFRAVIFLAIGDIGPAGILAGTNHIQFVAAHGTVFHRPQFTGFRMQKSAVLIAVADGINFRADIAYADKGIILGNRTIGIDAQYLAAQGSHILYFGAHLHITDGGDKKHAVRCRGQASPRQVAENLQVFKAAQVT